MIKNRSEMAVSKVVCSEWRRCGLQVLETAFAQFGPVEKAVVVSDSQTNTSRRFVTSECYPTGRLTPDPGICIVEGTALRWTLMGRCGAGRVDACTS